MRLAERVLVGRKFLALRPQVGDARGQLGVVWLAAMGRVAGKWLVEAFVAEVRGDGGTSRETSVVGFALFFTNFSTFLAQPGLYLEDLYIKPSHRGQGIGEALLTRLARLAVERNYGRFEWSVLDWNENAIRFYERLGATVMPDWRICRITGDALQAFAPVRPA